MNKITINLRKLNAKYHLKYRCPNCPNKRRKSRDVLNQGECFWYTNWNKGKYNVMTYQTHKIYEKLGIKKSLVLN